jgi:hypothetical protein
MTPSVKNKKFISKCLDRTVKLYLKVQQEFPYDHTIEFDMEYTQSTKCSPLIDLYVKTKDDKKIYVSSGVDIMKGSMKDLIGYIIDDIRDEKRFRKEVAQNKIDKENKELVDKYHSKRRRLIHRRSR